MKDRSIPRVAMYWLAGAFAAASCDPVPIARDRDAAVDAATTTSGVCVESSIRLVSTAGFGACLPRALPLTRSPDGTRLIRAVVRVLLPPGLRCSGIPGYVAVLDALGRPVQEALEGATGPSDICTVVQVPIDEAGAPVTAGTASDGFFYDTATDPRSENCLQRISFTAAALPPVNAVLRLSAIETSDCPDDGGVAWTASSMAPSFGRGCNAPRPPLVPGHVSCVPDAGCFLGGEIRIEQGAASCGGLACVVYQWDEDNNNDDATARARELCTCRCADDLGIPDPQCACPSGYRCTPAADDANAPRLRGSYCIPTAALPPDLDAGP